MAEKYDVKIKVISQQGTCRLKHKVGDEWVVKDDFTTGGICLGAFGTLWPYIRMMMFGGSFSFSDGADVLTLPCPDPRNPIIFELKRLPR